MSPALIFLLLLSTTPSSRSFHHYTLLLSKSGSSEERTLLPLLFPSPFNLYPSIRPVSISCVRLAFQSRRQRNTTNPLPLAVPIRLKVIRAHGPVSLVAVQTPDTPLGGLLARVKVFASALSVCFPISRLASCRSFLSSPEPALPHVACAVDAAHSYCRQ